jgi:hypothetical protein
MINKYSGITIILLAIVSMLASWMIYKKYTKNFYVSSNNYIDSQQLIRDIKIKPEAFESLKVMEDVVSKLSEVPQTIDSTHTIALSPIENREKRDLIEVPSESEKKKQIAANICWNARKMNVSMSFVTPEDSYAVIADKFVRVGEMVGKKYEVISIDIDKVKLRKNGVSCTVKVSGLMNKVAQS